jgi:hypothetical protein
MGRENRAGYLSLNRSLMNVDSEFRHLRLPGMNPFPKLDQRIMSPQPASAAVHRPVSMIGRRPNLIIGGNPARLPEMATDVIDASANYAVENSRRGRAGGRFGFGQLIERFFGGRRMARL